MERSLPTPSRAAPSPDPGGGIRVGDRRARRSAAGWHRLRSLHQAELLAARPPLAFLEVHSQDYFADGGGAVAALRRAREAYPISLHGVGLALGSAAGVDAWHLDRLKALVDRIEPALVSDHACFT